MQFAQVWLVNNNSRIKSALTISVFVVIFVMIDNIVLVQAVVEEDQLQATGCAVHSCDHDSVYVCVGGGYGVWGRYEGYTNSVGH